MLSDDHHLMMIAATSGLQCSSADSSSFQFVHEIPVLQKRIKQNDSRPKKTRLKRARYECKTENHFQRNMLQRHRKTYFESRKVHTPFPPFGEKYRDSFGGYTSGNSKFGPIHEKLLTTLAATPFRRGSDPGCPQPFGTT